MENPFLEAPLAHTPDQAPPVPVELTKREAAAVAGGINPQPLPPRRAED